MIDGPSSQFLSLLLHSSTESSARVASWDQGCCYSHLTDLTVSILGESSLVRVSFHVFHFLYPQTMTIGGVS